MIKKYKITNGNVFDEEDKIIFTSDIQKAIEYNIPLFRIEDESDDGERELKGWINGYKASQQTHLFTEEQMLQLWHTKGGKDKHGTEITFEQAIQSLNQQYLEVDFDWFNPKTQETAEYLPEITALNDNDGCYMKPKSKLEIIEGKEVSVLIDYKII